MRLSAITIFLEVIDQGSIRKAALAVNITPSAVSRHVAALETRINARLFDRRASGMVLTQEGAILERHARAMVTRLDVVDQVISEIKDRQRGRISISAIEAVTTSLIHPAIRTFRASHPDIRFVLDVVSRDNAEVGHALSGGAADIGLMYKLNVNSDLEYLGEIATPFAVIVRPDHPMAARREFSMADLHDLPVAALAPSSATRRLIDGVVRAQGIEMTYALTVNSFEMARQFALCGGGACILPATAVERDCEKGLLVAFPLTDPGLRGTRTALCIQRHRAIPPAAQEFLDLLRQRMRAAGAVHGVGER